MSEREFTVTPTGRHGIFIPDARGTYCTVGGGNTLSRMDGIAAAHAHNMVTDGLWSLVRWCDCTCSVCTT